MNSNETKRTPYYFAGDGVIDNSGRYVLCWQANQADPGMIREWIETLNSYAKARRDRDALLKARQSITNKFSGEDGLGEAMKFGFDAESEG